MADFDAIVVGAGHNGLTAAALLQKAGLRTLCLDSKLYAGGMASTVELFDGFKFEIAGSVQIPTSAVVSRELGLDELPTVDLDVMSVSLRGVGDEPLVYYTDPMKLMTHINEVHGAEAVNGMAGLMAWCQAPTRALGRFDAGQPPKTLDEMYACATNEFERSTITDLLFGSVTDVHRPLSARQGEARRAAWHALAARVQHHLSRARDTGHRRGAGVRVRRSRRERAAGQETARRHRRVDVAPVRRVHLGRRRTAVAQQGRGDPGRRRPGERRPARGRLDHHRARSSSPASHRISPSTNWSTPAAVPTDVRERFSRMDHRGSYLQMHFALDGIPEFAAPYELLNDPAMQSNIGIFSTPEELQQQWEDCRRGIVPADPSIALQIPSVNDPGLAPAGKHAASAFSLWFPIEESESSYGEMKAEMGQRVIDKITRLAPNFESLILKHTTFTPKHMGTMFGAPGGDYCHGLIHPDQIGPNRPGPKGYVDQPIPIDGLYLASAGCHGGPGITFVPGYNAAKQALADAK